MFSLFPDSFSMVRTCVQDGFRWGVRSSPIMRRGGAVYVAKNEPEGIATCSHVGSPTHAVVACVLTHGGQICLLRRSHAVGSDRGKWHCVTGFLPAATDPLDQARTEVHEETALDADACRLIRQAQPLVLVGDACRWTVFPFLFEVSAPSLTLNWEHDAYCWVGPNGLGAGQTVQWLPAVCRQLQLVA